MVGVKAMDSAMVENSHRGTPWSSLTVSFPALEHVSGSGMGTSGVISARTYCSHGVNSLLENWIEASRSLEICCVLLGNHCLKHSQVKVKATQG